VSLQHTGFPEEYAKILAVVPEYSYEFISIKSLAAKGEEEPGIMQGTADVTHPIAAAHLPEAASVFDAATALDTAMDMVDPQSTLI
jgi:hypothetical protein